MMRLWTVAALAARIGVVGTIALGAGLAIAQDAPPLKMFLGDRTHGMQLYQARCASCHDAGGDRTPRKDALIAMGPDTIVNALSRGVMRANAAGMSDDDIEAVAIYITGHAPLPKVAEGPEPNLCPKADPIRLEAGGWNGWSPDSANTRFQTKPGLTAADVPKLKVKWTFAYPGSKNTQVTAVGDRLFLGSNAGKVYSLNAKTGCAYWRYDAKGGVRTAPVVARLAASPSGYAVFLGDDRATEFALDAMTGKLLWSTKLETHARSMLTGASTFLNGVVYVPVSSSEEIATNEADYVCCSFRGSVVALQAATGKVIWKTYSVDQPAKPYRDAGGKHLTGPAGGAIWSAPTLDPKRGVLYATTGDSYTDVDTDGADAVMAIDLKTGQVKWRNQVTAKDNFMVGCPPNAKGPANCPSPVGPDVDFGSSVMLRTLPNGHDILIAGQKSGVAYGLDPDSGKTLWQVKLGRGGAAGGVEWGMASDKANAYVAIADGGRGGTPGLNAVSLATGAVVWKTPTPVLPCPTGQRCTVAQSAPVSAIPGVAFSGAIDGHLRAYDTKTGAIVWDFDTAGGAYDTVNGVKAAKGGALDATGPVIVNGMVFQHSGYPGVMMGPGGRNLLIAFSVDGK
ncbi:PQQ-binding-like beta-propeller repeat protein [Phenylobacterium sp.]|uniref:outer membrane protein assembly factor BamB family protein n=1 Tax=Phenylobacterium sp. TaxID=1871053 RepID=UPI002BDD1AAD|nr:PQQ-binding-like beta-propeller repeat protein [Phenylobacterium sp.]HLZ74697.1 PQQ-binding-like beta-propeller repeat protein [Phenylobacterium sp.]